MFVSKILSRKDFSSYDADGVKTLHQAIRENCVSSHEYLWASFCFTSVAVLHAMMSAVNDMHCYEVLFLKKCL